VRRCYLDSVVPRTYPPPLFSSLIDCSGISRSSVSPPPDHVRRYSGKTLYVRDPGPASGDARGITI